MSEKTDARVLKTKAQLIEALSKLTADRPIEEISVSELCRKARVDRSTFYRYYSVPDDIRRESLLRHIREFSEEINVAPQPTLYEILLRSIRIFRENQEIARSVFPNYTLPPETIQEFYKEMKHPAVFSDSEKLVFIAGGVSMVVNRLLREGSRRSSEDIARELQRYVRAILRSS